MVDRTHLKKIEHEVVPLLKKDRCVREVRGIGSYFSDKPDPNDIDLLLVTSCDLRSKSDMIPLVSKIDRLQDRHRANDGESLINVFVTDNKDYVDIADLWFHHVKGEPELYLRNEEVEEYIPQWKRATLL